MIIRYPLTILTTAALLIAGGTAFAGGMPSDESPEIILDTLGFNSGESLDENTITAMIKGQVSDPVFPKADADMEVVKVATIAEAPETSPVISADFWPLLFEWSH